MPNVDRLTELLHRYETCKAEGHSPTPEEMCRDCPELLEQFHSRLSQQSTVDISTAPLEGETLTHAGSGDAKKIGTEVRAVLGYEILEKLGQGGMGVVYKARHVGLNRFVAIKMVLAGANARQQDLLRFFHEAQAVAKLRHPNIVPVYDVGRDEDCPYFTMEFVEGGSLAQKLAGTPQPARQAAAMVETLARAMQVAHENGIVHRDLKPGNILLSADGSPKITDFGLAKRLEDDAGLTQSGAVLGTPSYMAPEQAQGDPSKIGCAVDVYALGSILYEMLTGRPPFRGETSLHTMMQVQNDEPVPPARLNPKVPLDVQTICLKCLQKQPGKRYASAAALAEDLRRFAAGEPILARPTGPLERAWRWCRRKPAQAGLAAAVVLIFLLGIGGAFWYVQDRADRHADQLRREADSERQQDERKRKKALAEQGIRNGLDQAEKARQDLQGVLGRPGGVFVLLDDPSRWEAQTLIAQGPLNRAKVLCGDRVADSLPQAAIDPALVDKLDGLEALVRQDETDRKLAMRLDAIRKDIATTLEGKHHGFPAGDREYAKAFAEAGLAVLDEEPPAMAAKIAASSLKELLVAALDDWALAAWAIGKGARVERLLAVSRLAAPDAVWGDRLRQTRVWRDPAALAAMIKDIPPAKLSPQMIIIVSNLMQKRPEQLPWLRQAQRQYPSDFWLNLNLAYNIEEIDPAEAIGFLRAAVAIRKDNYAAHVNLGTVLKRQQRLDEAIAEYEEAIALNPKRALGHFNLGVVLAQKKRFPEAIAAFHKVMAVAPEIKGQAAFQLGLIYLEQKRVPEALAACDLVLGKDPTGESYYQRAVLLAKLKRPADAIVGFQQALAFDPPFTKAYNNLGAALADEGRWSEAIAAFQKAAEHYPNSADIQVNLGGVLLSEDRFTEATAAFQKAVSLEPKHKFAYFNLGMCLINQNQPAAAGDALKKAVALNPKFFQAHGLLAEALVLQGLYAEAEAATQKELALLPRGPAPQHIQKRLQDCRRLPELEKQLPLLLADKTSAQPGDLLFLAKLYHHHKKQHATASRLYELAFKAQPALANDLVQQTRYQAAVSAVLAGCGPGAETARLNDKEKATLRRQARAWLEADLALYAKMTKAGKQVAQVVRRLQSWQQDTVLAAVREAKELTAYPQDEQKAWEKLWSDVAQLLKEAEGRLPTAHGTPIASPRTAANLDSAPGPYYSGCVM